MRRLGKYSVAASAGILCASGIASGGCMNYQQKTRVVRSEPGAVRLRPLPIPAVLDVALAPHDSGALLIVSRNAWCRATDTIVVTKERIEKSTASDGRWAGVIALGAIGIGAAIGAIGEDDDRLNLATASILNLAGAFAAYYGPLAAEKTTSELLPPETRETTVRPRVLCASVPVAGGKVALRLGPGEWVETTTDAAGRAFFDAVDSKQVSVVMVNGVAVPLAGPPVRDESGGER